MYIFHNPLLTLFNANCTFMLIIYCISLFLKLIDSDCYDLKGTKRQIVQYNGMCEDLTALTNMLKVMMTVSVLGFII